MDFFQHQDRARRNTLVLIGLLVAAVICLIAVTTVFAACFIYYFQFNGPIHLQAYEHNQSIFNLAAQILTPQLIATLAAAIIAVVAVGSLFKWLQLRDGGRAVAEALGGRLLIHADSQANERKILNVVEEMAIASGTPVPPVYLLPEASINAFAAGFYPQDAVIGITEGAINALSRDELQGVIAHEFSHILNGDMRLNIQLVSALHGILAIGLLGRVLLRSSWHSANTLTRTHRGQGRRQGQSGIAVVGLGLIIIGYTGTLFGRLIKAAISRQREFLADASAVQFTRNPGGIAGALKKIGGYPSGSAMQHPNAEEFSHLYFGTEQSSAKQTAWKHRNRLTLTGISGLFATHPPLPERIRRLEPSWSGRFLMPDTTPVAEMEIESQARTTDAIAFASAAGQTIDNQPLQQAVATTGTTSFNQIQQARALLNDLPAALQSLVQSPFGAEALSYRLLLSANSEIYAAQLTHLRQRAHPVTFNELQSLIQQHPNIAAEWRLPLLELATPALKQLSIPQAKLFRQNLVALIRQDHQVELLEWVVYRIIIHTLQAPAVPSQTQTLEQVSVNCQMLLSFVARAGSAPESAYREAAALLNLALPLLPITAIGFPQLDVSLDQLKRLRPLQKPKLLKALAHCINQDQTVTVEEAEIFRAIADSLNCPMPPLPVSTPS